MNGEPLVDERSKLEARFKSGANWFFWIAALSLINSGIILTGHDWNFIVGLGTTLVIDAVAREAGTAGKLVAFGMDLVTAAFVVLFGVLCRKRFGWAFVVGMLLYALDGLIFLGVGDWLGAGFHVLVLVFIGMGYAALRKIRALPPAPDAQESLVGPPDAGT
jgi:hypothetical protein